MSKPRFTRPIRCLTALAAVSLFITNGCADEVGGDGWEPPKPTSGNGGSAGLGGESDAGGDAGGSVATGGKGGKGGGGTGAKGGKGGSGGQTSAGTAGTMSEAGTAGEPNPGGAVCGNMLIEAGEDCDDGNQVSGDDCPSNCRKACEVCEQTFCKALNIPVSPTVADFYNDCFNLPGAATQGRAAGVPLKELCTAVVDCVRREGCAQFVSEEREPDSLDTLRYQFLHCYCALDIAATDYSYVTRCGADLESSNEMVAKATQGKCFREMIEASQRDVAALAFSGVVTAKAAFGGANLLLLQCDLLACREECYPERSSGTVAQITADILSTVNEAGESPLGNLIADAQRSALNTDVALVNASVVDTLPVFTQPNLGFFYKASPGRAADADGRLLESEVLVALFGPSVRGDAYNLEGGTSLVTVQATGQEIYDWLNSQLEFVNVSGLTFAWDAQLPRGSRVTEVRKGGVAIDKAATYSVGMNNALADTLGVAGPADSGKSPLKELLAYLKSQPQPIAPPALNRITRSN